MDAVEESELEAGVTGDGGEADVESHKFGGVMDAQGGDEEVERARVDACGAASLAKDGGIPPEVNRSRQQWEGFELGLQERLFRGSGVTKDFEGNRFTEAGRRVENPRMDRRLEFGRGFLPGEIHPQRGVDQSRHASARVLARCRSPLRAASKNSSPADHSPARNLLEMRARFRSCSESVISLRIAGPFLRMPVNSQISRRSDSGSSTVIFMV